MNAELEYIAALVFGLPPELYLACVVLGLVLIVVLPFWRDDALFRRAEMSTPSGQRRHQPHCRFIANGPAFASRRLEWGETVPPCKLCHPDRKDTP